MANAAVDTAYATYEHVRSAGELSGMSEWSRLSPRMVELIGGLCDPNFDTRWTVEQAKRYLLVEGNKHSAVREGGQGM